MLYEEYDSFTDEERKDFIHNIKEASDSTYKLLQNLLEWSRAQTGKISFNPEKFQLQTIIDETITTILARGNHKQSVLAGEALFTSKIIKIIHVSADYLQAAWGLYQKYKDKMFSFTDVTSFAIMKDLNIIKAFAFDREFAQAGIELIE